MLTFITQVPDLSEHTCLIYWLLMHYLHIMLTNCIILFVMCLFSTSYTYTLCVLTFSWHDYPTWTCLEQGDAKHTYALNLTDWVEVWFVWMTGRGILLLSVFDITIVSYSCRHYSFMQSCCATSQNFRKFVSWTSFPIVYNWWVWIKHAWKPDRIFVDDICCT